MSPKEWNELITMNNSKFYQLYEWGELLNKVHGHRLFYLEEEKGVFPLALVKSNIFGNRLISLPFADYGGPIAYEKEIADKLISRAKELAGEMDVDYIEIRSPDDRYFSILEKNGFTRRDDYFTYITCLDRPLVDLWKSIGNKNRNMIRKAEKNNVKIIHSQDKNDIKTFYKLYLRTMKRLGSPPQPYRYFETLWGLFYPGNSHLILANYYGNIIASNLYLLHKDTIYHAYNCSSGEFRGLGSNNLMQWSIMKWGIENGYKYLDFGRTREKAGNVLFKSRWGAEAVTMPYYYKFIKKELEERDEIKYKWISNIWSKYLPMSVADYMGPAIIKEIG